MTLKLDPQSIWEDGGESTVTATLDRATSETVTLTVSATAVSPAVPGDFAQSANQLTITAGQTSSTGTVTITTEDNDVDAPAKTLTVSAVVTSGPMGLTGPASQTLTITDDETAPTVTLKLDPPSISLDPPSISEDGGESTVTATLDRATSETATLTGVGDGCLACGTGRLRAERASADDHAGSDVEHGDGDDHDGGQRRRRACQNLDGIGRGDVGVDGPDGAGVADPDDHGRRNGATVTLTLDPASISEDGGESATVTATLDRATSERVTLTVSATAVPPAVPGDFALSANNVLTITAGQTTSTRTVTIAAEDDDVDAPAKTLTVSATVTSRPIGLAAPASQTPDDHGRRKQRRS